MPDAARRSHLPSVVRCYGLALLATALAALLRWGLHGLLGQSMLFVTFYPAVAATAIIGGAGPGLLATLLSVLAVLAWSTGLAPGTGATPTGAVIGSTLFAAAGVFISILADMLCRSRQRETDARLRHEQSLRDTEERFQAMVQGVPSITFEADAQGNNTFASYQWCAYTGLTLQGAAGWGWVRSLHPDDIEPVKARWAEAARAGSPFESRHRLRAADGSYRWFLFRALPARDPRGNITRWAGSLTDIDDLVRAQEALRASEEFNRRLIASSHDCIKVVDLDANLLSMNEGGCRLMEIHDVQPYLNTSYLNFWKKDDWPMVRQSLATALAGGVGRFEGFSPSVTGKPRWWDVRVTPIRGADGRPERLLIIARHTTDAKQAEQALRRSEELHRAIARNIPDSLVCVVDQELHCLVLDGSLTTKLGLKPQDSQGRPLAQVLDEQLLQIVEPRFRRALAGESAKYETKIHGRVVFCQYAPLRDEQGRVVAAMALSLDITDRKRTEEALRHSEQRFAAFMHHLPGAAWMKDLHGRYVYANPEAERIFSKTLAELRGQTDDQLFSPETARQFRENDGRVLTEGGVRTTEILRQSDGLDHYSIVNKFAVPGPRGPAAYIGGVALDITEHKRAEEALRHSEQQFRQLADAIPQIAWTARPDGTVDYCNQRVQQYDGIQQCPDGTWAWTPALHPDDVERTLRDWQRAVESGQLHQTEHRLRSADGQWRWHLVRALPLHDEQGRVTKWVGTATDIQDRKQFEADLAAAKLSAERAMAAAEQANRAKDHFLAVLSHELRTPLTPVLTNATLLAADPQLPQRYRDDVEMIRRNVELEARLIDDLLDVTRIVRGKIELDKRPVAMCEVLRRALEVCQPDIEARALHFSVDFADAASCTIHADPARLQQAFWNLIKNAIKFTPHEGRVAIRCQPDGDSHVIAEVTDNGEGIDPALLPHIFNAFEQGGAGVTRQFGGLGLGLTITRGLVEMHGGTIEAHSQGKGKGATFRIRLPLYKTAQLQLPPGTPEPAAPARSLRILLVEDHGDTAKAMRRLLIADGHEVQTAADVATALELAASQTFDLLISDLGLPDRTGLDLMRELRAQGKGLPGIALSGYGQEQDIRRSHEAGFITHLTKPTSPDRLAQAIVAATAP